MKTPITTAYSEQEIVSAAAKINAAKRKRHGPAPRLRPCPRCGQELSAREMRRHKCKDPLHSAP